MSNGATSPAEVPIAYLYRDDEGSKELIFDCNGEHARVLLDLGYTETPLFASRATDTALAEEVVDSGMSAKAVERAEWLWANLPTGRKWTGLATHEKALVCHTLAVLEGKRT